MAILHKKSTIRGGFFVDPRGGVRVIATGPFTQRALMLIARVGDVPVIGVRISPTGGSFTGSLTRTPQAGDFLFVRYPPEPEVRTGVRYQPPATSRFPVA